MTADPTRPLAGSLGYDDPQDQVGKQSRDPTGDQGNQKRKPEPKRADPEELSQSTADASDHAVSA